jgi:membrane protein implicated in regulation of membrane protease activity
MTKTNKLSLTIALLGALAMPFSSCKNVEPNTTFNPDGKTGMVKDIEGNAYAIIKIGDQWWMAENLKTTQYRNGTPIDYPGTDNDA